ncbi:transmembrane protein, putative [Ichthyophthirius multifiliis]|uniref:Transmembrane protein, putative n=1 Tax=Ichthyophthirius multifiliis TaxID=5932 RepID=G0QT18_ICHMU|nr:transmembrane protein, putative [Ichthyophthirius multifiliis]EGR31635.1 transmembrane protein, putative [Ichthyophthirius multifiliis]|eukprot:XP_004035121.1 transmembrane protein, putative [Ichthyophthirius multifiliis]
MHFAYFRRINQTLRQSQNCKILYIYINIYIYIYIYILYIYIYIFQYYIYTKRFLQQYSGRYSLRSRYIDIEYGLYYNSFFFVKQENHKYEEQYERSLIYKLVVFKFVNSYFSLFYVSFIEINNTFSDIFYMLLPIMLIKQVIIYIYIYIYIYIFIYHYIYILFIKINYMILSFWFPKYILKYRERKYFRNMQEETIKQQQMLTNQIFQQDSIEQYWERHTGKKMKTYSRTILYLQKDEDQKNNNPPLLIVNKIDADSVELNSIRSDFFGTINQYADSFIDLGYITLFAAAFPIGPMIALLMNTLEIRNKIIVFLDIIKRPSCERCVGINDWIYIWEALFFLSIFSNIGLLYLKDKQLIDIVFKNTELDTIQLQQYKSWCYFGAGGIIFVLKMTFQYLIKDKPQWILSEEKKLNYIISEKKKNDASIQNQEYQDILNDIEKVKINIQKIHERQIQKEKKVQIEEHQLKQKIKYYKKYSKFNLMPFEKDISVQQYDSSSQIQNQYINKQNLKPDYYLQLIQILKKSYVSIERQLLINKLQQILQFSIIPLVQCSDCNKILANFYCLKCQLSFCQNCFDIFHQGIKGNQHKIYIYQQEGENQIKDIVKPNNNAILLINEWKKMEDFSIPTFEKSLYFKNLTQIYYLFYEEYIKNNGINIQSQQINLKKILNIQNSDENPIIMTFEMNRSFYNTIHYSQLDLEDKIFLNRIAFLSFKRFGNNCSFNDFLTLCKFMQVNIYKKNNIYKYIYIYQKDGYQQQKILLFMDFLDEDEEMSIYKYQINKIFYQSAFQNIFQKDQLEKYIEQILQGQQKISKQQLAKLLIDRDKQNKQIIQLILKLFQGKTIK